IRDDLVTGVQTCALPISLLQPDARAALIKELLPLALVVTPNLHEAEALAGMPVVTESDMEEAARRILALGAKNVLVKGGHLRNRSEERRVGKGCSGGGRT